MIYGVNALCVWNFLICCFYSTAKLESHEVHEIKTTTGTKMRWLIEPSLIMQYTCMSTPLLQDKNLDEKGWLKNFCTEWWLDLEQDQNQVTLILTLYDMSFERDSKHTSLSILHMYCNYDIHSGKGLQSTCMPKKMCTKLCLVSFMMIYNKPSFIEIWIMKSMDTKNNNNLLTSLSTTCTCTQLKKLGQHLTIPATG